MSQARVMIVEDESIVALDIKNRLRNLGYAVAASAAAGEEALRKAEETRPDLILMDIRLKGEMDGIQAASEIRSRLGIPVIYLTAYADEPTLQRAKLTEPFGYLIKPFEERELRSTIEMALYRYQMEKRVQESERWLATTLSSIGDAVIATDEQGRIKFLNPVAEALTGWAQAEAMGRDASDVFCIIHEETHEPVASPIVQALNEGRIVTLASHTLLTAKDGRTYAIEDSAAPIRDDRGAITGVVLVFRDVTERRHVERERERLVDDLSAYAHSVAHDLKNPLAALIGYSQLISDAFDLLPRESLLDAARAIQHVSNKMVNIVDELLLLAEVREGRLQLHPLDMGKIVAAALQRLSDMIHDSHADIHLPDAWPTAIGYAPWIEEVWVNYLSNAIKYGGRPPRLELGATVETTCQCFPPSSSFASEEDEEDTRAGLAGDGQCIRFWVRDNGNGIAPADQARLFAPYTRLDQARARGHGLGLSIVRRIMERLGGRVGVESEGIPGAGSVFYFELPKAAEMTQAR